MDTLPQYAPALQAAVEAALAKFPDEATKIHRGAEIVHRGYVREPAGGKAWLIGVHGYEVNATCHCLDTVLNKVDRCKHCWAKMLYIKMHRIAATPPVRTLQFYATLAGVGGVATVYETGQAFFQADDADQPRQCTDEEIVYHLILGGRIDICHAAYPPPPQAGPGAQTAGENDAHFHTVW